MSTKLSFVRDVNAYDSDGIFFPEDAWAGQLAANTEQHFVVPANFPEWVAIFTISANANIWMSTTATATVPAGTIARVNTVLLNPNRPTKYQVKRNMTISLITADTTTPWFSVQLQVINNYDSFN